MRERRETKKERERARARGLEKRRETKKERERETKREEEKEREKKQVYGILLSLNTILMSNHSVNIRLALSNTVIRLHTK